jgi:hypothetical protein
MRAASNVRGKLIGSWQASSSHWTFRSAANGKASSTGTLPVDSPIWLRSEPNFPVASAVSGWTVKVSASRRSVRCTRSLYPWVIRGLA